MKTLSVLSTFLALGSAVLGLDTSSTGTRPSPSEHAISPYSAQFEAAVPAYPMTVAPKPPSNLSASATGSFQPPSPMLVDAVSACPYYENFCQLGNCCPHGSYCTIDGRGQGACCNNGAVCTGLSTPLPGLIIASLPVPGTGNILRPARAFGFLAGLAELCSVAHASGETTAVSQNAANTSALEIEGKKGGRCGGGGCGAATSLRPLKISGLPIALARIVKGAPLCSLHGNAGCAPKLKFTGANPGTIKAAANHTSSASGVIRPLKIIGLSVALARSVRGVLLCPLHGNMACAPKVKFMGGNPAIIKAEANHTSIASGMLRPPRLFSLPFAFAQRIEAAVLCSRNGSSACVPKLKFSGPNPGTIKAETNHTSSASGMPQPRNIFRLPIAIAQRIKTALT